jgi:hypothetical protein
MPAPRPRRLALACALTWLAAGCGAPEVRIEGAVTFDGEPVPEGSISFEPADGRGTVTGGPIAAGRYAVVGGPDFAAGEKLVRIVGVRKTGRRLPNPEVKGEFVDEIVMYIPGQFNRESGLKVQVSAGANVHDFPLQGAERKR